MKDRGALSSSSSIIAPHILRRRPPPFSLFKHLQTTTTSSSTNTHFISLFSRQFSLSSSSSSLLHTPHCLSTLSSSQDSAQTETDSELETVTVTETEAEAESGEDFENPDKEEEEEEEVEESVDNDTTPPPVASVVVDPKLSSKHKELLANLRGIDIKEKKELASYAHSLGKKLKLQSVGKSGVTEAVGIAMVESLESKELLKIKIHNNCPQELDDAISRLEEATGSIVVSRIGRTVILYRPSLTKLVAEEKKKQAQKIFLKRRAAFHSSFQKRGRPSMPPSRSREGGGRRSSNSAPVDSSRPAGRGRRGAS